MYRENNIGPRIEPCGTPTPVCLMAEMVLPCFRLFNSTYCFLLDRYDSIHLLAIPLMPYTFSLSSNSLWSRTS